MEYHHKCLLRLVADKDPHMASDQSKMITFEDGNDTTTP